MRSATFYMVNFGQSARAKEQFDKRAQFFKKIFLSKNMMRSVNISEQELLNVTTENDSVG